MSTEYLQQWFTDEYSTAAVQYIANAMSIDLNASGEVPEPVKQKCNVLRDMFAGFSSNKYSPPIPKLKAMIRFADSVSDLDGRMVAMITKCKVMLTKKEAELVEDALGF